MSSSEVVVLRKTVGSSLRSLSSSIAVSAGFARNLFEDHAEPFELFCEELERSLVAQDLPAELVELASSVVGLSDDDPQTMVLLALATLLDLRQGSTRTQLKREHLCKTLGPVLDATQLEQLLQRVDAPALLGVGLIGPGDPPTPLVLDRGALYTQRMFQLERSLAQRFNERLQPPETSPVQSEAPDLSKLSTAQQQAVQRARRGRCTLITGGPGTGKSTIVVALMEALLQDGHTHIALAAPTGKAAHRLAELLPPALSARFPPQTLHRLLGFDPHSRDFFHHDQNPLIETAVIVDEASMIDLRLMERLLSATAPQSQLVLLGDPQQLPSVEAGAVFQELTQTPAMEPHTARLHQNFRVQQEDEAGRALAHAADAVRGAKTPQAEMVREARALRFQGVEALPAEQLQPLLERWYQAHIQANCALGAHTTLALQGERFSEEAELALEAWFARLPRAKLLCVHRGFGRPTSAGAINRLLHQRVQQDLAPHLKSPAPFLPGEPVMMLRNDYERGLFNGDQGLIAAVRTGRRTALMAVFKTAFGYTPFHIEALQRDLSLAHAMTIHKSQGSEFWHVGLLLPEQDHPLLTRALVYTALTRARRSVTLVGDSTLIERATQRPVYRDSGLRERIGAGIGARSVE